MKSPRAQLLILVLAWGIFGVVDVAQIQAGGSRPNILFIMSDDHGYQPVSAYGSGLNLTPDIDRIANEMDLERQRDELHVPPLK